MRKNADDPDPEKWEKEHLSEESKQRQKEILAEMGRRKPYPTLRRKTQQTWWEKIGSWWEKTPSFWSLFGCEIAGCAGCLMITIIVLLALILVALISPMALLPN